MWLAVEPLPWDQLLSSSLPSLFFKSDLDQAPPLWPLIAYVGGMVPCGMLSLPACHIASFWTQGIPGFWTQGIPGKSSLTAQATASVVQTLDRRPTQLTQALLSSVQGRHSEVQADWAGPQRGTPVGGLYFPVLDYPAVYGLGCADAICCKR